VSARIRIGISSCLLGQAVRYDGGHKYNEYITETLGRIFEFVAFCPEVAIGMGVPRPPIQLVKVGHAARAQGVKDAALDVTDKLEAYADKVAPQLKSVSGYILKSRSPSCGLEHVAVHSPRGRPVDRTSGVYAGRLLALLPALPFEDEERLKNPRLRNNFIERVFTYHRWQQFMAGRITRRRLAEFHAHHVHAVPARNAKVRRALVRLAAGGGRGSIREIGARYLRLFMQAQTETAKHPPRRRSATEWSVYILRCGDGSFYTGVATDVRARVAKHNRGKGAKYTRGRRPVQLVYREPAGSRGAALKREYAVKQLTRAAKHRLIARQR